MPLITHFIQREIDSTIHANTLFRTNTMATKLMSSFAKIAGGNYLRKLLYPIILFIIEQDFVIEIDEKKRKENSPPINEQVENLLKITQQFFDHIIQQISLVPVMFRRICHCLYEFVRSKFEDDNQYHGIGGFIFLRFICPAIVAPDAFSIIKTKLSAGVRRTLVLISKVLQNLANGIKHAKEEYMIPTNIFVENNEHIIQDFFHRLASIDDLAEDDSTQITSIIPIPLVEESLSIIHRLIIREIDKLKEELNNTEVIEAVPYHISENLNTVLLKSEMVVEQLKTKGEIDQSSPLFKPYFLFIDAILASGCYIVRNLLSVVQSDTESNIVSESLMVVVHSNGNSLEFIKQYIQEEINAAAAPNIAFTTMNITNHLIWGYFKILTREFMHNIWAELINDINQTNADLEIDPLRLTNSSPQLIDNNNRQLIKLSKLIVDKLFLNISKVHPRVREMCEHIQSQMTRKFGNIDKYFSARLVTKRIFSMALSYPTIFHLLPDLPQYNARRSFILSSKILNNVIFDVQSKDAFMEKVNEFTHDYHQKSYQFLDQLRTQSSMVTTFSLSWDVQRESLVQLHQYLMKYLPILTEKIGDQSSEENIVYNIFDRLAAVIALYRYKLRRKTIAPPPLQ